MFDLVYFENGWIYSEWEIVGIVGILVDCLIYGVIILLIVDVELI